MIPCAVCACGCKGRVPRPRARYVNRRHMVAHRRACGLLSLYGQRGGRAGALTKQRRAVVRAAVAAGVPLTAREAALYRKAYANGYSAGQKAGSALGVRKGWADALGEQDAA
jgi:hypothetical protein